MPLSEEFQAEVSSAVDQAVAEVKANKEADAPETQPVVEKSAVVDAPETPVAPAKPENEEADNIAPSETPKHSDDTSEGAGGQDDAAKAAADAAAAPAAPKLSDAALTQAVLVGIPLEDARTFQSDESLLRVVVAVRDAMAAQVAKDAGKDAPKTEEQDPLAALPTLDPEVYEPDVIKMFDAMKGILKQQQETIKSFQSSQQQVVQANQQAAAREVETWFDSQVKSLGDDFKEALGAGDYGALDRGSSQFAKRDAIANQMAVLLAGYRAAGQKAPSREEVFNTATRIILRDEYAKAQEKKLAADLAKRSTQHIQRASGQKAKVTGDPLAEIAADLDAKYFRKN